MMGKTGILRISRFYDITHETVVITATYFGILRKCSITISGLVTLLFLFHVFAL